MRIENDGGDALIRGTQRSNVVDDRANYVVELCFMRVTVTLL